MSTYCTRADIEAIFGTSSVSMWADMNEDENAADITARIALAITVATEEITERI